MTTPDHVTVWVRGCRDCGSLDLHTAHGCPTLLDRPGWRCAECGSDRAEPAAVDLPAEPTSSACPLRVAGTVGAVRP